MAATELYKAIAQPSEHSFLNRFDVDEEALRRVRQREPGEATVAAGGELPPEARHDVVHGHQRLHPGELVPGADAGAAAEGHEGEGRHRRRVIELSRVEPAGLREDGRVPLRHVGRVDHLPALGYEVATVLDVLHRLPHHGEHQRHHPQRLQHRRLGVPHLAEVLPRQSLPGRLAPRNLFLL